MSLENISPAKKSDTNTPSVTVQAITSEPTRNVRRSVIKGISGSALLSSVSSPVWATYCSVSGQVSGNISAQNTNVPCGHCLIPPSYLTYTKFKIVWELLRKHHIALDAALSNLFPSQAVFIKNHWEDEHGIKDKIVTISMALSDTHWAKPCALMINILAWHELYNLYRECKNNDNYEPYQQYQAVTSSGFYVNTDAIDMGKLTNDPIGYADLGSYFSNHVTA